MSKPEVALAPLVQLLLTVPNIAKFTRATYIPGLLKVSNGTHTSWYRVNGDWSYTEYTGIEDDGIPAQVRDSLKQDASVLQSASFKPERSLIGKPMWYALGTPKAGRFVGYVAQEAEYNLLFPATIEVRGEQLYLSYPRNLLVGKNPNKLPRYKRFLEWVLGPYV